jgi:hypothetical protein
VWSLRGAEDEGQMGIVLGGAVPPTLRLILTWPFGLTANYSGCSSEPELTNRWYVVTDTRLASYQGRAVGFEIQRPAVVAFAWLCNDACVCPDA